MSPVGPKFGSINPALGPQRQQCCPAGTLSSVINLVNSGWLRTSGYLLAAAAAFVAGRREVRSRGIGSVWGPRLWFLAAAVLLVMALVRGTDLAHLLPDLGRRRARSE